VTKQPKSKNGVIKECVFFGGSFNFQLLLFRETQAIPKNVETEPKDCLLEYASTKGWMTE